MAQEDSKDVQNFQDQWKSDTGAAQKLAAQVKSANLPAEEMAVADQVGAIENKADADVKELDGGWSGLEQSANTLAKDVQSGQGSVQQDAQDASALLQQAEDGVDAFADAMQGIQAEGNALVEKVEG